MTTVISNRWLASLAATFALAAASCETHSQPAPSEPSHSDALTAFRERCTACHQAPDLAFATDRAWLDQIRGTA